MARAKGPRKVLRYDNAFKVKAVKLSELPGVQFKDVAESLDIHPFIPICGRNERGGLMADDEHYTKHKENLK